MKSCCYYVKTAEPNGSIFVVVIPTREGVWLVKVRKKPFFHFRKVLPNFVTSTIINKKYVNYQKNIQL